MGEVSQAAEGIIELESILLLVILGSLVVSAVMVGTCLMAVAIQLHKRKPLAIPASASGSRETLCLC